MKVYIQTDLEGIAGFCFFEHRQATCENLHHRRRMYRLLTGEVNAAVCAAFDSGADEVYVNDSHGSGYNILFEELDPRCRIIHGRNCSGPHWLPLLDESFDALVLIGMHAMGGTPRAVTPHTRWVLESHKLTLSEGAMAAAIAGDFGVPTVFASGDDKVTAELREKIPALRSVVSKQALSPYQACSLIPARCRELIRSGTADALRHRQEIAPYRIPGPVTLTLLDSENHAPPLREVRSALTAPTINEAFLRYERSMAWTHFDSADPDDFVFP